MKGWGKIIHANGDQKRVGLAILTSYKIDFKSKTIRRDKEWYYIMIKGSIQQESITILNIYATNIRASKHKKANSDTTEGRDSNTITVGDFNTLLAIMDRTARQKVNKETADLNNTIDQMNLTDIYRTFLSTATKFIRLKKTQDRLHV